MSVTVVIALSYMCLASVYLITMCSLFWVYGLQLERAEEP